MFRYKLSVVVAFACLSSTALGDLVNVKHVGSSDPTTQGWTQGGGGAGTSAGPLINDAGSGLDAWFVDDSSTSGGLGYAALLSAPEVDLANTLGWSLTTTLRIPNALETAAVSPFLLYANGTTRWQMAFGSDAEGDPLVLLMDGGGSFPNFTGASFTLEGVGNGYHTYELVFDPDEASADLFIDGTERISDYAGFAFVEPAGIGWGTGSSADTGRGHFNLVEFSVVPEPSGFLFGGLVAALASVLGGKRRLRA